MKFLSVALAALVGFSEAKKSISGKDIKTRMQNGQFNKKSLLRNAKPYGAHTTRKLEEEEWEINGLYSVMFDSCFSLTIQNEDMINENYINMAAAGEITAEKSYVLFKVCLSEDCYYQADDEKMTFITDIASFFQAFYDFLPNQVESYCEGCKENEDYCFGNIQQEEQEQEAEQEEEGEQEGEEGEQEGEEGGERKLAGKQIKKRKLANNDQIVEYIDCQKCFNMECYDEEDQQEDQGDDVVYEFEDAIGWLEELSQCQQMEEQYYNGLELYAGLICNADGDGIEVGVFMDGDCTMYSNKMSYASIMSYADQQYYGMSQELVEYMFTNDFSCYQPEIVYTNPYEEQEEEEQQDDYQEYEAPEAAEWCEQLMNGEFEATNMYDCGIDANEEQEENEQEYDENLDYYDWYSYQLNQDAIDDEQEACQYIKSLDGEYTTVYDKNNGGSLFNYKKNNNLKKSGMSGGAVAAIVILVLAAAGAAAYVMQKKASAGDKKAPLINNGSMA